MIKYENVTFDKSAVAAMSREEFIERHIGIFWQDRDERTRRKMLEAVYRLVRPDRRKDKESED